MKNTLFPSENTDMFESLKRHHRFPAHIVFFVGFSFAPFAPNSWALIQAHALLPGLFCFARPANR